MLQTKDLIYGVRNREILRGIDLDVQPGEFVGIIGPNGSGKSTLLKQCYKTSFPQSGSIFLQGKDLLAMTNREMAQILSVVVQEHETSFDFTVEEVVMMGRFARKGLLESVNNEDKELVTQVLAKAGLQAICKQSFSTLSGGEKQRALIARALVQNTTCIILDEPTNHLDIKYQLQLMDLVKNLNCTVVAAIHDLNIAAAYCDKIYALKEGKVVGYGTPRELLTPSFIQEIYEVKAKVIEDPEDGELHIHFYIN